MATGIVQSLPLDDISRPRRGAMHSISYRQIGGSLSEMWLNRGWLKIVFSAKTYNF